ncbi:MAG: histidine kinase [Candidatus Eremiobacteraeota bacterium]|nr:histidine kinase [Candidatus Eremiobacteraeota bacterium]
MVKSRILIAEANPKILAVIESSLDSPEYELEIARDGVTVMKSLQKRYPDLVIMDLLLPKLDGRQILNILNTQQHLTPVIIISSSEISPVEHDIYPVVEGYFTKPFIPLYLKEKVKSILSRTPGSHEKLPEKIKNVLFFSAEGPARDFLSMLIRNWHFKLVGICVSPDDKDTQALAGDMGIAQAGSLQELMDIEGADILLYSAGDLDEKFLKKAGEKGIEIIQGRCLAMLQSLLHEKEVVQKRERAVVREFDEKVREFAILTDLSGIVTSTFEIESLQQKIIQLCLRVLDAAAGAIIMYDDRIKKFTVSSSWGLSDRFIAKVQLSLSDTLIEDFITIRKEMAIPNLEGMTSSVLLSQASRDGMKSMAAFPLLAKEKLIGILCLFSDKTHKLTEKEKSLFLTLSGQIAISIENAQLYRSAREKQTLVEHLLSKVIVAQEEERKRIAGEIHDGIAQSMVGILTKIQTSQSLLAVKPESVAGELEELRRIVAESVKEIRHIIFNLRPSSLDDLGLVPSIENLIKRIEKESSISIMLIVNEREKRLPPMYETLAFRIVQEALINVRKHSHAQKAWVEIYFEPAFLSIKIVDNGKGFRWEKVHQKFTTGDSFGLQTMKERASLVGGTLDIISDEAKGTTVSAGIPMERSLQPSE